MHSSAGKLATARQVEMIVRQLDTLSTFPQVAGNALRLLASWPMETSELIELLKHDPALSARILAVSSSRIVADGEPALSIEQAAAALSGEQLRDALLSVGVFQAFDASAACRASSFAVARRDADTTKSRFATLGLFFRFSSRKRS